MIRKLSALALAVAFAVPFVGMSSEPAFAQGGGNVVVLTGDITTNVSLKRKKTYLLRSR